MASIFPEAMSPGGCVTGLGDSLWARTNGVCSSSQGLICLGRGKKYPPAMQEIQETWVPSLGWEDSPEEGMATNSSTVACRNPWIEEAGRLQFIGSQRVRYH